MYHHTAILCNSYRVPLKDEKRAFVTDRSQVKEGETTGYEPVRLPAHTPHTISMLGVCVEEEGDAQTCSLSASYSVPCLARSDVWSFTFASRSSRLLRGSGFRVCEDRLGTGPPRARTEVIYVDLGYWAVSGSSVFGGLRVTKSVPCFAQRDVWSFTFASSFARLAQNSRFRVQTQPRWGCSIWWPCW